MNKIKKRPLTLILLAIFFGVFAWLYILEDRKIEFWIGISLSVLLLLDNCCSYRFLYLGIS